MVIKEERYDLNGREVLLRCPVEADAQVMIDYLVTVSGETRFLRCDPDENRYTLEQELAFIQAYRDDPRKLFLQVFVEGEYAGNASFCVPGPSRRNVHRAEIGIALFERFTGQGIGTLLMNKMIDEARSAGFWQCELSVVNTNVRAYGLYRRLGFRECGRIPNANRYADGTCSDDILMVLDLQEGRDE